MHKISMKGILIFVFLQRCLDGRFSNETMPISLQDWISRYEKERQKSPFADSEKFRGGGIFMKNRRRVIALFVALAVLCMGIGYAALTDELVINGEIGGSFDAVEEAFDMNVYFSDVVVPNPVQGFVTCVAEIDAKDADSATMIVNGFGAIDQSVTAVFTIKNDNAGKAVFKTEPVPVVTYDDATYADAFKVELIGMPAGTVVDGNGGTIDVTVKVTVVKDLASLAASTTNPPAASFKISMVAEPLA